MVKPAGRTGRDKTRYEENGVRMLMGWRRTLGCRFNIEKTCGLLKQNYKFLLIRFINKKILSPSGTLHYMLPCIRIFYSQRSQDKRCLPARACKVNRRFDPIIDPWLINYSFWLPSSILVTISSANSGLRLVFFTLITNSEPSNSRATASSISRL